MDLAEQLTHFYGPEPALEVARKTLKRADVRDVAAQLQEQRLQRERAGAGAGVARSLPAIPSRRTGRPPSRFPGKTWRAPCRPVHPRPRGWDTGPWRVAATPYCVLPPPIPTPARARGLTQFSLSGLGPSSSALLSVSGRSPVGGAGPGLEQLPSPGSGSVRQLLPRRRGSGRARARRGRHSRGN